MLRNLIVVCTCAAGLAFAPHAFADAAADLAREANRTDQIAASTTNVEARIAASFPGVFGTPEETGALVADLRSGAKQGKPAGTMGYGEIHVALSLAQAYAAANSISGTAALDLVLAQRIAGVGWGKAAQELGLKLGPVVSRVRAANAGLARAEAVRAPRVERAVRPERPEKPEKPERPQRPERPERGGRG